MIEIHRIIEKEIEKLHPKNTIFKGKEFYFRLAPIIIILIILTLVFIFIEDLRNNDVYMTIYLFFSYLIIPIVYFLSVINSFAKRKLLQKRILPDRGLFKHWANKNYYEFKYNKFYKKLIELNILTKNDNERNQKLLKEYSDHFKYQSEKLNDFEIFKIIGGLFLLFFAPLWRNLISKIFKISDPNEIIEPFQLSLILFLILTICIITIISVRNMIKEIVDTRKKKLNQLSIELLNLKWNEELKTKHNKV